MMLVNVSNFSTPLEHPSQLLVLQSLPLVQLDRLDRLFQVLLLRLLLDALSPLHLVDEVLKRFLTVSIFVTLHRFLQDDTV